MLAPRRLNARCKAAQHVAVSVALGRLEHGRGALYDALGIGHQAASSTPAWAAVPTGERLSSLKPGK
jgi:hypothetical protein